MASNAILEQKKQQVELIKKLVTESSSFVLIDYCGINVAQDNELRSEFRKNDVKYAVIKNRLLKIALNELGYTQFDEALNGPTAVAFGGENLAAPAKIANDKAAAFKKMKIKCGMVDGIYLDEAGVKRLATLPSKEGLIAMLLGMLQAPIAAFARAIDAIAKKQANA